MTKPFDYRTIDINKLTESANPQLWKLITLMTASKSRGHVQRQRMRHTTKLYKDETILLYVHTTFLHKQPMLHANSSVTHRCCQSEWWLKWTHKGSQQFRCYCIRRHAQPTCDLYLHGESEIKNELASKAFRVTSIDNIDVLLSHASAHAGKPSNIWHGTSNMDSFGTHSTHTNQAASSPSEKGQEATDNPPLSWTHQPLSPSCLPN